MSSEMKRRDVQADLSGLLAADDDHVARARRQANSVFARDPGTRACPRGDGPSCRHRKARASAPPPARGKPNRPGGNAPPVAKGGRRPDGLRADATSDLEASSSRRRCCLESTVQVHQYVKHKKLLVDLRLSGRTPTSVSS